MRNNNNPQLSRKPKHYYSNALNHAQGQIIDVLDDLINQQDTRLKKQSLTQLATRALCKKFSHQLAHIIATGQLHDQLIEQIITEISQKTFEDYSHTFNVLFQNTVDQSIKSLIKKRSLAPYCTNASVISKFLALLPLDERVAEILSLETMHPEIKSALTHSKGLEDLNAIMARTAADCNNTEQQLKIFILVFRMDYRRSGYHLNKTAQLTKETVCYMVNSLPISKLEECAHLFVTFIQNLEFFEEKTDYAILKLLVKQLSTVHSKANAHYNLVDVFFLPLVRNLTTGPRYQYGDSTPNFFGPNKLDYYLSITEMATPYAKQENRDELREVLKKMAQSRDSLPHRQRVQVLRDELCQLLITGNLT